MVARSRPHWAELPAPVRRDIERLVGGRVVRAQSCIGGFSGGFASRLTLDGGHRVFVKAMDAQAFPQEAVTYRAEALVAAALPAQVPAPRLLATLDTRDWTVLAFADIDGVAPGQPWRRAELDRVLAAVVALARAVTPAPVALPRDHPRLGGWAALAGDGDRLARLAGWSGWAAANAARLAGLERDELALARGDSLVHFDLYPHNILLAGGRVMFIDWPHARLGASVIDLLSVGCSAAADGIDPEPLLHGRYAAVGADEPTVTGILAALAGFMVAGGLPPAPAGLEAIAAAKLRLGRGALGWLRRRLGAGGASARRDGEVRCNPGAD
jgi:hypothetical protein